VVDHEAIEAVGWGPMVMGFLVEDPSLLSEVAVGDKIRLDIRFDSPKDFMVIDLEKIE
jgi:Cu/Ag efflux protein CusF